MFTTSRCCGPFSTALGTSPLNLAHSVQRFDRGTSSWTDDLGDDFNYFGEWASLREQLRQSGLLGKVLYRRKIIWEDESKGL